MENNVLLTEEEQAKLERRRRNKRFNAVLYCVSAALVLFGVYIILRDQTNIFDRNTAPVPEVTDPPEIVIPTATPKPTEDPQSEPTKPPPTQTPEPASAPVGVYFEGHDISVAVVSVGVDENGAMETVPQHNVAGWYMYGPAPISSYEEKDAAKFWKEENYSLAFKVADFVAAYDGAWEKPALEAALEEYIRDNEWPMGKVMNCIRLALTGSGSGLGIADITILIGKEEFARRIETAKIKI